MIKSNLNIKQMFLSPGKKARGLWTQNPTTKEWVYNQVFFTKPIDRITLHWIGPFPHHTPEGVRNWWENGSDGSGIQSSTHFIVKEIIVLQTLPLDEVGWHSSDARNYSSIGIEVIPMNLTGEFSRQTMNTLKELVQYIRKEIGRDLILDRHFDNGVRKDCPRYYTNITSMVGVEGRVTNPEGGDRRWEELKQFLNAA